MVSQPRIFIRRVECNMQSVCKGLIPPFLFPPAIHYSNLANASSLLWHAYHSLPKPSNAVNWTGFYTSDPHQPGQLILGPFHGRPACQSIRLGKGVCGTAAAEGRIVRVGNVEEWPGHIACDAESRSEIVVPIFSHGQKVGVMSVWSLIWHGWCC